MAFELFDLSSLLVAHNQELPSQKVDVNTTFGLKVFSSEFNDFLFKGFASYRGAYYLHKSFRGKRIHEYESQLANSRSLVALRKLVAERKRDGEATRNFLLRQERAKCAPLINEGFAHFSHDALLEAHDMLRLLENVLSYARNEVKRSRFRLFRRVPSFVRTTYFHYIENQLSLIHKERQKIIRAMLQRLVQASKDYSLEHGDILYRLNSTDLVEDKFSQSHFHDFYNIVRSSSDEKARKRLSLLPWVTTAFQLSANPILNNPYLIYSLARLEIASHFLRKQRLKNEDINTQLEVSDASLLLIKQAKRILSERQAFLSKWWRRFFNKNTLIRIEKMQYFLQKEKEYVQDYRASLQQHLVHKDENADSQSEAVSALDVSETIEEKGTGLVNSPEDKINELENLLLSAVCVRFNLSSEAQDYFMKLKQQMLASNVVDVRVLPSLTMTDKTFLGLHKKDFFSIFYTSDDRQILGLALNAIVLLHREKECVKRLSDLIEQNSRIEKVTASIYDYLEKYGTSEIQQIIKERRSHVRSH